MFSNEDLMQILTLLGCAFDSPLLKDTPREGGAPADVYDVLDTDLTHATTSTLSSAVLMVKVS